MTKTFDEYQIWVTKRWTSGYDTLGKCIAAMGLAGEAGEAMDAVKKDARGYGFDREKLILELGDTFHYWLIVCWMYGIDPQTVWDANVKKLEARHGVDGRGGEVAKGKPLDLTFHGAGI